MLFYVGALIILMSVIPWTEFKAGHSPFIAMFSLAGLGIAATVVNLVVRKSPLHQARVAEWKAMAETETAAAR